jgi:hypothetical protein
MRLQRKQVLEHDEHVLSLHDLHLPSILSGLAGVEQTSQGNSTRSLIFLPSPDVDSPPTLLAGSAVAVYDDSPPRLLSPEIVAGVAESKHDDTLCKGGIVRCECRIPLASAQPVSFSPKYYFLSRHNL